MIEVELRQDHRENYMGDYEAWAVEGFTPLVEIVGYSEYSYEDAIRRLINALDELGIPGDVHVAQKFLRIKR